MKIIRLQNTGVDVVTFWTSPDQPEGCLVQHQTGNVIHALAAVARGRGSEPVCGLLQLPLTMVRLLEQFNRQAPITSWDYALVSTADQILPVVEPNGGIENSPHKVAVALNKMRLGINPETIREALMHDRQRPSW